MFNYVSTAQRVPHTHRLQAIHRLGNDVLRDMSGDFDRLYSLIGRPSRQPERLLRVQLLQASIPESY